MSNNNPGPNPPSKKNGFLRVGRSGIDKLLSFAPLWLALAFFALFWLFAQHTGINETTWVGAKRGNRSSDRRGETLSIRRKCRDRGAYHLGRRKHHVLFSARAGDDSVFPRDLRTERFRPQ